MTDYSNAPFWAISGIGYGKGFTPEEAVENYVKTQLRNYSAKSTIYKTRPKWEAALRTGDAKPQVWRSPEGFTGFTLGSGLQWTREVDGKTEYREAQAGDRVEVAEVPR